MRTAGKEKRSPLGLMGLLDIEQRLSAPDGPALAQQLDTQLQACLQLHQQGSRAGEMYLARRHAMLAELCRQGRRVLVFTKLLPRVPGCVAMPAINEDALRDIAEDLGQLARVRTWTAQSEQIFDLLARLHPDHPSGHLGQALLRLEKGHFREAGTLFSVAQRLAPENQQACLGMAMLHLLSGQFSQTVACLSPLKEANSENGNLARAMLSLPELRSYL
jgi:tetratricopeptide (TPR) repeat protein